MDNTLTNKRFFNSSIAPGLCFSICFFSFQLIEFTTNEKAEALFGTHLVNAIYSAGIACTALGFLSLSLLWTLFKKENQRRNITCIAVFASMVCSIVLLLTDSKALFLTSALCALLCYGYISGNIYRHISIIFTGRHYLGCFIGISMSYAVIIQFIVQNLLITRLAFIISLIVGTFILLVFLIKTQDIPRQEGIRQKDTAPCVTQDNTLKTTLFLLMAATVLMSMVVGLIDGVVVTKHAEGSLNVSSYARLFYALSLPIAGFVADYKHGRYLPVATVCILFISTISAAFMSSSETFFAATSTMYVYSGFYVIFFTVTFMRLAPQTRSPELWAGMGRILRSLTTAATALPVIWLFNRFGNIALIIGSCIFSIATLLVLIPLINKAIPCPAQSPEEAVTPSVLLSQEEAIQIYAEYFHFTPREAEVFTKLISTEDGVQEIADSFYISRRVMQRYIASIYEKTNTKSRIGLYQSFSSFAVLQGKDIQ